MTFPRSYGTPEVIWKFHGGTSSEEVKFIQIKSDMFVSIPLNGTVNNLSTISALLNDPSCVQCPGAHRAADFLS